jgi:uncharacterized repeat protein (TIGR03803 family)
LIPAQTSYAQDILWGFTSNFGPQGAGTLFSLKSTGSDFMVQQAYRRDPANPYGSLIQGKDGFFYGTTNGGGIYNSGTIFKIAANGTGFTVLKHLNLSTDGGYPEDNLLEGSDGFLYGVAKSGGVTNNGTIFKIAPNGTGFSILKSFRATTDGDLPSGGLINGNDGFLYGVTIRGGANFNGTIFKIAPNGTSFTVLKSFNMATDGGHSDGSLLKGSDGFLYGMTSTGGANSDGTIFKIASNGTSFVVLKNFNAVTDGGSPSGSLINGNDGFLYGMTDRGGNGQGTIFKIAPNGTGFSILKSFRATTDGASPLGSLVKSRDGFLYGMTYSGGTYDDGTIFKIALNGTAFSVIRSFNKATDGRDPRGNLIEGTDGLLYGMLRSGGSIGEQSQGTIFKVGGNGSGFTVLKRFSSTTLGATPTGSVVESRNGFIYGTTSAGGNTGSGTIFKVAPNGTNYTILKHFNSPTDGANPNDLMESSDGFLYGTAQTGGSIGGGTIFKLRADGTGFTVLRHFNHSADGNAPVGRLLEGVDGFLYGINSDGGNPANDDRNTDYSMGTIFKIRKDGTGFAVIRQFLPTKDGAYPSGGLIKGTDGFLYGTTNATFFGAGTIYKIKTDGTSFTILRPVTESEVHGNNGKLLQGGDGFFYGMSASGGSFNNGILFKIAANGTGYAVLKNFTREEGGPYGSLVQGGDGFLYGMTSYDGRSENGGTIFKIAMNGTGFTLIKRFNSTADGANPMGSLLIQNKAHISNLPSPWKNADIGAVSRAGSAVYNNGVFTLKSGGFDFYKAPDSYHYVYQSLSGNATIVAKVASIGNTHANALAGVMIRESLSASSSFVALAVNPSGNTNFMYRQGAGTPGYKAVAGTASRWLKLARSGNTFTSSYSADGINWTTIGSTSITMGSSIYVGMALSSQNNSLWNTATFSNVSVSTTAIACTATGTILREYWANITGTAISSIPVSSTPTSKTQLTSFEAPSNAGDNYGQRIRGYICAPANGNYTFYLASDDYSELWLSTSDSPSLKRRISSVTGYTSSKQWNKYPSQKSVAIPLEKGKKYYIEALHKEAAGGDNLAVGWIIPGSSTITVVPGSVLSPYTTSSSRLAIEEDEENNQVAVYPNPFENKVTLATSGMQGKVILTMTDVVGKQYFAKEYILSRQVEVEIEVSGVTMSPGIYLLKLQQEDGRIQIIKVIKK